MTKRTFLLLAFLGAVAASGCSTLVLESHRLPVEPKLAFGKTVVIVSVPEEDGSERARRIAENELAGRLASLNASPSFRLIAAGELHDAEQVKSWAAGEGFDGLVVIWLDTTIRTRLPDFDWEGGSMARPDAVSFLFKASVLSLKEDREVWTGVVKQRAPRPLTKHLPAVARAVAQTLRDEGLTD